MDTWINQGGYPLVRVGDDGIPDPGARSPTRGEPGGAIGSAWQVPVLTRALDGDDHDPLPILLTGQSSSAAGRNATGLVVNAGGSGYYRVSYPTSMVELLAGRLADLAPLERYNLVSDTWAAALSGQAPLADVLRPGPLTGRTRPRPTRACGR